MSTTKETSKNTNLDPKGDNDKVKDSSAKITPEIGSYKASQSQQPTTEPTEVPASVVELCRETFQKSAEYVQGELEGTVEDYRLLEKMNKVTVCKYSEMKHIAMSIETALKDLNSKYKSLQPYLEQIDQIEDSVASLEQAAYSLDHYSKRLEAKFKAIEKK